MSFILRVLYSRYFIVLLSGLCSFALFSGCEAVSEPTVSLSTFLLVHLPFSEQEVGGKQDEEKKLRDWPYDDADDEAQ